MARRPSCRSARLTPAVGDLSIRQLQKQRPGDRKIAGLASAVGLLFSMAKKLFLLDGMALVYRAHFALIARPIFTSKGVNTSALYGFTQTLLEIIRNQQPTHIAVAFDTDAPTQRHRDFVDYKATRQAMPEDLSKALPHVRRMVEAFRIPVLTCDGYEADDLIATLVRRAEKEGFTSHMVTPDKDFGQLVTANTFIYKPGRMGDPAEVLGVSEVLSRWGVQKPEQVVDVLALMGDSVDNIPGVPGIGEKTAIKLISQYGTVENLLAHANELTGRVKETVSNHGAQALMSKKLATLHCDAPCPIDLETLKLQAPDDEKLKSLLMEFEFNSIGRRLFGEGFKAGRGFDVGSSRSGAGATARIRQKSAGELSLFGDAGEPPTAQQPAATAHLKTLADVPHDYRVVQSEAERAELRSTLLQAKTFAFGVLSASLDPKEASLIGLAFSTEPGTGSYVPLQLQPGKPNTILEELRPLLESPSIEKIGHHLKFSLGVMKWHGISIQGALFDTLVAHSIIEPEMRHGLDYVAEAYLGYTPLTLSKLTGLEKAGQASVVELPLEKAADYACEATDLALRLRPALEPLLKEKGQERVFYEIETPLIPVLADMECEGVKVDATALADFAAQLAKEMDEQERAICRLAGTVFNLNSPRQLGQILFDVMQICEPPKKTKTGQYSTDEQTLLALAPDHEVVRRLLEYRTASKLKSTYADALPGTIWPRTSRIHTTFNQVATSTGRLNSQNPNLQNIPIRTERGQEIRRAFVPRGLEYELLSADYSQIELRVIAALSGEGGLLEAFKTGGDVHTATAAKVFGVLPDLVTSEMRRKAKMVNYGIAYGISSFGLAQRLGIPRKEAAEIIDQYFTQFAGIRKYMEDTIIFAREHEFVETVTGRRRYIRDIRSSNNTIRSAAERNAINAPIQGTAADMIKIAMVNIHRELVNRRLKTRMVLQVHDELVFDLYKPERDEVLLLVEEKMKSAIPLEVPIVVELGTGKNWLEAH